MSNYSERRAVFRKTVRTYLNWNSYILIWVTQKRLMIKNKIDTANRGGIRECAKNRQT